MSLTKNGSRLEGQASTPKKTDNVSGTIDVNGNFQLDGYERQETHWELYRYYLFRRVD